ncbi:MAG: hypothetical protein HZB44_07045 [Actinobacteria bacterium]|nr:hypothetical protein [Actinomycetota bacterium]
MTAEHIILTTDYDSSAIADLVRLGQQVTKTGPAGAFNLHGVRTRAETNSDEVARALAEFLKVFPGNESDDPDIRVHLFMVDSLDKSMGDVPADASMLYDWDKVKIYHKGPLRYLEVDTRARVVADVDHRVMAGFAEKELLQSDWLITNLFFYPLWGQLLKESGLFPLHAAGLVRDGRSCLFLGRSGSGKSTLALQLVRSGFGLLSDDTVFLQEKDGLIEALSFPEDINVTEQTMSLIPELSLVQNFTANDLRNKSSFSIEELYPDCVVETSVPALMAFPEIAEVETSSSTPMSRTEALALAMRYGYFFLDPSTTGRHFEILSLLTKQTSCFRLYCGRNQGDLGQVVDGLLTASLAKDKSSGERK